MVTTYTYPNATAYTNPNNTKVVVVKKQNDMMSWIQRHKVWTFIIALIILLLIWWCLARPHDAVDTTFYSPIPASIETPYDYGTIPVSRFQAY
jgi:hypothetical protein